MDFAVSVIVDNPGVPLNSTSKFLSRRHVVLSRSILSIFFLFPLLCCFCFGKKELKRKRSCNASHAKNKEQQCQRLFRASFQRALRRGSQNGCLSRFLRFGAARRKNVANFLCLHNQFETLLRSIGQEK